MRPSRRRVLLAAPLLAAAVATPALLSAHSASAANPDAIAHRAPPVSTAVPAYDHVVVTFLENEDAAATFEDPTAAPNLARLEKLGAYVPGYYGVGHNSLDNYLALFGGEEPDAATQADCLGHTVGSCEYDASVPTLATTLTQAGKDWRIYSEGMDGVTGTGGSCLHQTDPDLPDLYQGPGSNGYATRHNPAMWFHSVLDDAASCDAHSVDLTQLAQAESTGLPAFSFVEPDTCHDGHDDTATGCTGDPEGSTAPSGVAALDQWLGRGVSRNGRKVATKDGFVTGLLSSPAWHQGNNLLVITFDEAVSSGTGSDASGCVSCADGSAGGRIGALLIGTGVRPGYVSTYQGDHYGLLRTLEEAEGLPTLSSLAATPAAAATVHDGAAAPITDIYAVKPSH